MSFHQQTREFREQYRKEQIGPSYSGTGHFWFTTISCLLVISISIYMLKDVQKWEWIIIPATFLYANFVEYIGHKGPMHHRKELLKKVFHRHTLEHHRFFTDEEMTCEGTQDFKMILFPPVLLIFFFFGFAVPATLLMYWLWSANAAWLLLGTLIAYYLNYEWLHLSYHLPADHWVSQLPLIRKLRNYHYRHHDPSLMQKYNFNISYPIFDWIFKTLKNVIIVIYISKNW